MWVTMEPVQDKVPGTSPCSGVDVLNEQLILVLKINDCLCISPFSVFHYTVIAMYYLV